MFKLKQGRAGDPTPYFFDNYKSVETYTNVANGKTATLVHQGLFKDLRIEHVEGTIYQFTAIETGRPVVAVGPDGKKLLFDRGRIRYTFLVDTKGDADLSNDEFLGDVVDPDVAGPHPIFFEVADFCDLLDVSSPKSPGVSPPSGSYALSRVEACVESASDRERSLARHRGRIVRAASLRIRGSLASAEGRHGAAGGSEAAPRRR